MKTYVIAGISLRFNYRYETYFKNNIESYQQDVDNPDYTINIIYEESLTLPKNKGTKIFTQNASGTIKAFMSYDDDFKNIDLYIDPKTLMDLATAEYVYSGMVFLEIALKNGLIPIQGTAILYKNDVILFSAPPGTGKSTQAKLWMHAYPNDVLMVNDDKPLLSIEEDGIYVSGSPFSGAKHENTNKKKKLKSIVFLTQGVTNKVENISPKEAFDQLVQNSLRPQDEVMWQKAIMKLKTFLNSIPAYHLEATPSLEAVHAVHDAIYK